MQVQRRVQGAARPSLVADHVGASVAVVEVVGDADHAGAAGVVC